MKALTIRQPWATLIALGVKTIETRSWRTNYRGPLAIHAGLHRPERDWPASITEYTMWCDGFGGRVLQRYWFTADQQPGPMVWPNGYEDWPMPLGAVVATCTLVDCVPVAWWLDDVPGDIAHISVDGMNANWWRHGSSFGNVECISDQLPFGDFRPGRWAWLLENITPCDPVPAKGKQGLWEWQP